MSELPDTPRLHRIGAAGSRIASMNPSHPVLRRVLRIGVPLLVVVSLAIAAATQWSKIPHIHWRFEPLWLIPCVASLAVIQPLHAELWRLLLKSLGSELEPRLARKIWCVSLLGRYVPTSALMAVGRIAMTDREGVPQRICLASVVYEVVLTVGSALAVGAYFTVTLPALSSQPLRWLALALPVGALVMLHPRVFHRLADFAFQRLGAEPLPVSIPFVRLLAYGFWFVATFVLGGIALYSLAQAIHGVGATHIPTIVGAYAVGFTVSVIGFFSPAGLGAREAGLIAGLSGILPFTISLAVAVLLRLIQIALDVFYAGLTTLLARRGPSRRWSAEASRRKLPASASDAGEPIS